MPPRPLPPPPCPPCQGCDLPGGPPLPDGGAPLPLPRAAKIKDYRLVKNIVNTGCFEKDPVICFDSSIIEICYQKLINMNKSMIQSINLCM